MTTPTLNLDCDGFADALGDYLEGDATDAVRSGVDAHAAACASCAALLSDMQHLATSAASLPPLMPSRDLWSGIAERIDAPVIPMTPSVRQVAPRRWARPVLAAAALVAATAGVTHYLTRASLAPVLAPTTVQVARSAPAPAAEANATIETTASQSTAPVPTSATPAASAGARLASRAASTGEPVLDLEITKLRRLVNERRDQLDPRTVAILEQSMAVIDSAIAQSRAALAQDPASAFLATQLNRSLEKKVELLRTATLLPASD